MVQRWHALGRDTRWVMIAYGLWGVGEGLWMFLQPLYLESLGATSTQTGSTLGMWGMGRLLFILPSSILADRIGARRLMLPGWYIGLAGVAIIALAPNWHWAALGFLVYGMSAIAIPITNLYLTQAIHHDPTRQPDLPLQTALTMNWATYSLGLVVSPIIGGWIGDTISLRAVFMLSVFWFVLSTAAITRTAPYPVPQRPAQGHAYSSLLRQRHVTLAFAVIMVGFSAVLIGQPLSSQYLEDVRGLSNTIIGALGSVNALGTAFFSVALGRMTALRGFYVNLLLVMVAFALFMISGAWPVIVAAMFLLGAHYTTRPFAASVVSERVSEHHHGMAYALVEMLAGLATVVGTNAAGVLYGGNPTWPFWAGIGGVLLAVMLGALLLQPRNRPVRIVQQQAGD